MGGKGRRTPLHFIVVYFLLLSNLINYCFPIELNFYMLSVRICFFYSNTQYILTYQLLNRYNFHTFTLNFKRLM